MKKWMFTICGLCLLTVAFSQEAVNVSNFEKAYIAQEYKKPFKRSSKVCFLGVNLTLKMMSFDSKGSKNKLAADRNRYRELITYIPNLTNNQLDELSIIFRKKLEEKFAAAGFTIVDPSSLSNEDTYQKLVDNTIKFDGKIFFGKEAGGGFLSKSTNNMPVFKFPKFAGGAHSRLANQQDVVLVNISPVIQPYSITWDRKYKGEGYGVIEYTENFDFEPVSTMYHFSNIFLYDLPNQIQGPDYSYINLKGFDANVMDKLVVSKGENFIKEVKAGVAKDDEDLLKKLPDGYKYQIIIDYDKFKANFEKIADAYAANLAAYAAEQKN